MRKTKIVLMSILTIAMCISLIAGATFALFTSESDVNIAITSGKVDVIAKVNKDSLELMSMGEKLESNTWVNGGVAGFTDKDELELRNITPGDKVTFTIDVTSESNINIKYRVIYKIKGTLSAVLDVNVDGFEDGVWTSWAVNDDKSKVISVSVELPESVGNEYQDSSATISFAVEAIQGNATITNSTEKLAEKMAAGVYTADGRKVPAGMVLDFSGDKCVVRLEDEEALMYYGHYFDASLAYAARKEDVDAGLIEKSDLEKKYFAGYNIWYADYYGPTTEVVIASNMNFENAVWDKPLSIYGVALDGQNHTFKNLTIKATGDAGSAGLFNPDNATLKNFKVENVHADATEATGNSACGVVAAQSRAHITNVTVTNSTAIGGKYTGGIVGYIYGTVSNCNISNVEVDTQYKGGGLIGYQCANGANSILNNVLKNVSVKCTNVLDGKVAGLGVLVGNMNCLGDIVGNVATDFDGATSLIGVKDGFTHKTENNYVNGQLIEAE